MSQFLFSVLISAAIPLWKEDPSSYCNRIACAEKPYFQSKF